MHIQTLIALLSVYVGRHLLANCCTTSQRLNLNSVVIVPVPREVTVYSATLGFYSRLLKTFFLEFIKHQGFYGFYSEEMGKYQHYIEKAQLNLTFFYCI